MHIRLLLHLLNTHLSLISVTIGISVLVVFIWPSIIIVCLLLFLCFQCLWSEMVQYDKVYYIIDIVESGTGDVNHICRHPCTVILTYTQLAEFKWNTQWETGSNLGRVWHMSFFSSGIPLTRTIHLIHRPFCRQGIPTICAPGIPLTYLSKVHVQETPIYCSNADYCKIFGRICSPTDGQ